MVTFILVKRSGNILVYRYYPNDNRSKSPGEITVDLDNQLFEITELAETILSTIFRLKKSISL